MGTASLQSAPMEADLPAMPAHNLSPRAKAIIERMRGFRPTAAFPYPATMTNGGLAADIAAVIAGTKPAALLTMESIDPKLIPFSNERDINTIAYELLAEARKQNYAVVEIPFVDTAIDMEFKHIIVGQHRRVKLLASIFQKKVEGKYSPSGPPMPEKRIGILLGYGEHARGTSKEISLPADANRPRGVMNRDSALPLSVS
jgi:hypothetical protein